MKSATLVEDGVARFPDAPTVRGRRHVDELTVLRRTGDRSAVIFIISGRTWYGWSPSTTRTRSSPPHWQRRPSARAWSCTHTCDLTPERILCVLECRSRRGTSRDDL
ncbi:MAG: DNA/RNA nuclease SfsA [Caldilineaceae bacterium]